ncbi:hypothetical protein [Parvularcula sp. LCG005]|uniref:HPr kinase/phosphorylase n=1 Tax=Parvularcula sp. LCG005 TaxID=3078805 RepID=UPI002943D6F9|nr:hypothetical protein [Parvularcula sp. LCG005]WOI53175.1 hypothetical protein RUI03_13590 [Parvularcula sp. LCG005]
MNDGETIAVATVVALAVDADGPLVGIALTGPSGSGKTSAAFALVEMCPWRRSRVLADDGVILWRDDRRIMGRAHPRTRATAEARRAGIMSMPTIEQVVMAMVFDCTEGGERLPPVRNWPSDAPSLALPLYSLPPIRTVRPFVRSVLGGHSPRSALD